MSQNRESTDLIMATVLLPITNIKFLFPCCFKTGDGRQIHQFSSVAQSCPTLCNSMDCSMPGFTTIANSQSFLKLMSIESVIPSNYLILCHPLLLPSIVPSIRVFFNELALHIQYSSQSFGASSSAPVLPINIQGWFLLGLSGLISSQFKGLSRIFSNNIVQKHQFFGVQLSLCSTRTFIHDY